MQVGAGWVERGARADVHRRQGSEPGSEVGIRSCDQFYVIRMALFVDRLSNLKCLDFDILVSLLFSIF